MRQKGKEIKHNFIVFPAYFHVASYKLHINFIGIFIIIPVLEYSYFPPKVAHNISKIYSKAFLVPFYVVLLGPGFSRLLFFLFLLHILPYIYIFPAFLFFAILIYIVRR